MTAGAVLLSLIPKANWTYIKATDCSDRATAGWLLSVSWEFVDTENLLQMLKRHLTEVELRAEIICGALICVIARSC